MGGAQNVDGPGAPLLDVQGSPQPVVRQQSRRLEDTQQVHQRPNQASMTILLTWARRIVKIVLVAFFIAVLLFLPFFPSFFICKACYAAWNYSDLPCDQPLASYLPLTLAL